MHYFGLHRGSMLAFPLYGNFFLVLVFLVEVCLFKNPTESRETQRMLFFCFHSSVRGCIQHACLLENQLTSTARAKDPAGRCPTDSCIISLKALT